MNNKLLEILDEFDKLTLGYCDDDELDEVSYLAGQAHFKEYYKRFLKEKLVEYGNHQKENLLVNLSLTIISDPQAKSIITSMLKHARDNYIDQYIQSLNN